MVSKINTSNDNCDEENTSSAINIDMKVLMELKNHAVGEEGMCIKPNKLRKIVCTKNNNITWTQFASSLERLVSEEKVDIVINNQGEDTVRLHKKMFQRLSNNDTTTTTKRRQEQEQEPQKIKKKHKSSAVNHHPKEEFIRAVRVPPAIVLHLTKNHRAKLNSIEQNTKTIINVVGWEKGNVPNEKRLRESYLVSSDDKAQDKNMMTLTIEPAPPSATDRSNPSNKEEEEEEEDVLITKQRKRLNFAVHLLETMINSFKEHPEHFLRKKRDGNKAEGSKDQQLQMKNEQQQPCTIVAKDSTRRKRRKFY